MSEGLDVAGHHGAHAVDAAGVGVEVRGHHGDLPGGVGGDDRGVCVGEDGAGDWDGHLDRLLVDVGKSRGGTVVTHV